MALDKALGDRSKAAEREVETTLQAPVGSYMVGRIDGRSRSACCRCGQRFRQFA